MLLKNVICFHLVLEMLIGHSPSLANLSIQYVRFIIFIFSLIYIYHKDLYPAANMQGIHHWGLLWKATCFLSRECTLQAGWTELHLFYIGHWVNEYLQVANVLISLEEVSIIIDVVQVILPKSLLQDLKKTHEHFAAASWLIITFLISAKAWVNRACSRSSLISCELFSNLSSKECTARWAPFWVCTTHFISHCTTWLDTSAGILLWIYRRLIGRSYIALARQYQYIGSTRKTQILIILVFVAVLRLHL